MGAECEKRATISRVERFKAILGGEDGEAPTVELPFDAKERFGKARAPVRGTVDGTEFRTTVAVYGGRYLIGFNRELRERAGIAIGDEVDVTIRSRRRAAHRRAAAGADCGVRRGRGRARGLRPALLQPSARVRRVDRRGQARRHPLATRREDPRQPAKRPALADLEAGQPLGRSPRSPPPCRRPRLSDPAATSRPSRPPASGAPSKTASTAPSERLLIQPVTPSSAALLRAESRKKTPWTRPCTTTRRRTVSLTAPPSRSRDGRLPDRLGYARGEVT